MSDQQEPEKRLALRRLFRRSLPLESETSWFLLLGVLDLVLTTVLLAPGEVREANPVARFFLHLGGLRGLIAFKFALLAVVAGFAQIIALRRPRTAKVVLQTGIVMGFLVLAYSCVLMVRLVV